LPRNGRRFGRRRRASHIAVAVAALWSLGIWRLAYAVDRGESPSGEPAIAALLTVVPPVALAFRSTRELLFDA
jgi:hypothetical protein